jgi:hypothetical protein
VNGPGPPREDNRPLAVLDKEGRLRIGGRVRSRGRRAWVFDLTTWQELRRRLCKPEEDQIDKRRVVALLALISCHINTVTSKCDSGI